MPVGGSQSVPVAQWTAPQRSLVQVPVAGSHTSLVPHDTAAQGSAAHTPWTQCMRPGHITSAQLVSQLPPRQAWAALHEATTQGSVAQAPVRTSQI